MPTMTRRDLLRAGSVAWLVPSALSASPSSAETSQTSFSLSNGLRVHCASTSSSYISAILLLRSKEIMGPGGLAHILEHTSFSGAAGLMTAPQVKERHKAVLHDSNASTAPGFIQWQASFLPRRFSEALRLLATTSLDQKFDVDTVASEARVVLQELYLDKYDSERVLKKRFHAKLYGAQHPYSRDTADAEIAKANTPPEKLAAELRQYAQTIRLPANMDLFLVGRMDGENVEDLVGDAFGKYPFAEGRLLDIPNVAVTRTHHKLKGTSQQLKRPLSELKIAWNTGVRVMDPDAAALVALSHYMNDLVIEELREKGYAYSPDVSYQPDRCSGVFKIAAVSSKDPALVERRILRAIDRLKTEVKEGDLDRFKDRLDLSRMKAVEGNDAILKRMVERLVDGGSVEDCDIDTVTANDVRAAARKFLPASNGAYVLSVLSGRELRQ